VVYDQSRTREAHEEDETHEGREDHEDAGAKDTEEVLRYASVFAVNG
jgi:hypothetical protein